jgi:hypothetical protein
VKLAYDGFYLPYGSDFKLQNARPAPYCLYSQTRTNPPGALPPTGNCLGFSANNWMTFQVHVKIGQRVNDEWANSFVKLWIASEGQPSQLAIDWGPYNLSAGQPAVDQKFGKIWLTPFMTGKDETQIHPTAYTWFDELIISRQKIADPL